METEFTSIKWIFRFLNKIFLEKLLQWINIFITVNIILGIKEKYKSITLPVCKERNSSQFISLFLITVLCEVIYQWNHFAEANYSKTTTCWGFISLQIKSNLWINSFLWKVYFLPSIFHRHTQDWHGHCSHENPDN